MNKLILSGLGINIKLYRSKPAFFLMSATANADYIISLDEVVLKLCKCTISPFNFRHFNVSSVSSTLNNNNVDGSHFKLNMTLVRGKTYIDAHRALFEIAGRKSGEGNGIGRLDWANGKSLLFQCFS